MKRIFLAIALFAMSCTTDPHIVPDPLDASLEYVDASSSSSSSASSASSSASSSSSSSASSSSGGPQGDVSGSRLKRYVLESADGLSVTSGTLYDSQLDANCAALDTPMGKRCIVYDGFFGYAFVDASCTMHAALVFKGCQAPKRVARADTSPPGTCAPMTTYRVYDVGQMQPQAYRMSGNTCDPLSAAEAALYDVYSVGAEVDYTQFAAMTLEHE
jgi:hypothetical protein